MPAWRGGKPNVKWRFLNSGPKHIAMRHISAVLALALLLWAGCTQPSGPGAQNESAFLKAGCAMDNGDLNCSAAMERAGLGQCRLHLANISGLGTPVAECWRADEEGGNGIYAGGCMLRQAVTYVVPVYTVPNCGGSANCMGGQGGWGLQELRSRGDFASYFGPVKNGSMAIAYAAALTGDTIDYTGGAPRGARAFMKDIPPTAAKEEQGGYLVNLLHYQFCGCGPHAYLETGYFVTPQGQVRPVSQERAYENPEMDGLCVD